MSANLESSAVATGLEKVSFHSNPKGNAKNAQSESEVAQSCPALPFHHVSHFLLQRIFPTQGWNPGLLHCRQTLCPLSHPNYRTIALISHASKAMLKILQDRLQQYVNPELPDVQAGFRKVRGTRDQIANIH